MEDDAGSLQHQMGVDDHLMTRLRYERVERLMRRFVVTLGVDTRCP
jgi:hypothetical protein